MGCQQCVSSTSQTGVAHVHASSGLAGPSLKSADHDNRAVCDEEEHSKTLLQQDQVDEPT